MKYINALIILVSLQTVVIASESSVKLTPQQLALLVKDVYKSGQPSKCATATAVVEPQQIKTYFDKNALGSQKNSSQSQPAKPYYCEFTKQHFASKSDHYNQCEQKKRIKCPECLEEYAHTYIKQHLKEFHGSPAHSCTKCGKKHRWRKQAVACCRSELQSVPCQMQLRTPKEGVKTALLAPTVIAAIKSDPMEITSTPIAIEQTTPIACAMEVTSDEVQAASSKSMHPFFTNMPDAKKLCFGSPIFMELAELG